MLFCFELLTYLILPSEVQNSNVIITPTNYRRTMLKVRLKMNSISEKEDQKLLFKFGIIADVQYVDAPDALNFNQVKLRKYRQSKSIYGKATECWSSLCNTSSNADGIRFALVLGKTTF